jgi:diguanylate cyclase (GGDEF)-like protein
MPERVGDHDSTPRAVGTETVASRRAVATTEHRPGAAWRKFETVRRQKALRTRVLRLLTESAGKAQRFASRDELTGLPKRHLLMDRFKQAVALAARHNQCVTLLFLDMDGFQHVNNTLGHSAGDKLLQQFAARLLGCVRAADTVFRYGGDQFVLLLSELRGKSGAAAVAEKIRAHLAMPYIVDGDAITMTMSLGIAVHPTDAVSYADLVRIAKLAMQRDKARHPAAPDIFDPAANSGNHSGR